jgi:hypothetical protein
VPRYAAAVDCLRRGRFIFEAFALKVGIKDLTNGRRLLQGALFGEGIAAATNRLSVIFSLLSRLRWRPLAVFANGGATLPSFRRPILI